MKKKTKAQKLIEQALWELMKKKAYSDITVTELVERAGVARVSYYRLFNSFDEVLDNVVVSIFEMVNKEFQLAIVDFDYDKYKKSIIYFFEHINQLKIDSSAMMNGNARLVLTRFSKFFNEVYPVNELTAEQKYLPVMRAGVVFSVAIRWAETGMVETPEEMANFLLRVKYDAQ